METVSREGILFVFVGPTGSGKTTVAKHLVETFDRLSFSLSATTRKPREGEQDGVAYHFMSDSEFREGVAAGQFFEHEQVHGNLYGTPLKSIESALADRRDLVLAIDINGALNLKKSYPKQTVLTFLVPPSREVMLERLQGRGEMCTEDLARRLQTAESEYSLLLDLAEGSETLEYLIVNNDLETTLDMAVSIVKAERCLLRRIDTSVLHEVSFSE